MDGTSSLAHDHREMLRKGMLSVDTVKALPGVSNPESLIAIMERFDMLIRCQIDLDDQQRGKEMYMVPCLLKNVASNRLNDRDQQVPAIHFKCVPTAQCSSYKVEDKGFLPPGVFHRLISKCCKNGQWQHRIGWIFYNYIIFFPKDVDVEFALHMAHDGISLFAELGESSHEGILTRLREQVEANLRETLQVFPGLSCQTFLICPCYEKAGHCGAPLRLALI